MGLERRRNEDEEGKRMRNAIRMRIRDNLNYVCIRKLFFLFVLPSILNHLF